jgi:hypothetical protein
MNVGNVPNPGGPVKRLSRLSLPLCVLCCLLLVPVTSREAPATAPATKEARIRELMRITGMANLGTQILATTMGSMQKAMPKVPDEFWRRMSAEAKVEDLLERVVPVYSSHFTTAEVNEMIEFYSTPTGKKIISEMPGVVQECSAAGQKWGQEIGARIGAQLEKEGYKFE